MNHQIMIRFFQKHYGRRLRNALRSRAYPAADRMREEYVHRFQHYMETADFGENDEKFSSFLNIYSGLAAYELLRESGFSESESIAVYDEMCSLLRKAAALSYGIADLLPSGFQITADSLKRDLLGQKAACWSTEVLEDSSQCFAYRISKCLYYETCKAHGCPEFTKVFCYHDRAAYGVLHRHVIFLRYEAIGEGGTCCHDAFIRP